MAPLLYWRNEAVAIYHGDARELGAVALDGLGVDAIITDPPYGETSLGWDTWPHEWPRDLADLSTQLWCFGSLRMFMAHAEEFSEWALAQDVIWEKHNGSSFANDRFRRVHEQVAHFYRGPWAGVYRAVQTTPDATKRTVRRKERPPHLGVIAGSRYTSTDGGPRLQRSVLRVRSMHGHAEHETEKPLGILLPLISYSVPPGGVVFDPFAGSGSTGDAARMLGRRAILCDIREECCALMVERAQRPLQSLLL